jgi:hypothetical protein
LFASSVYSVSESSMGIPLFREVFQGMVQHRPKD